MRQRVPQLDGLRGVAVLLVVWAHAWNGVSPSHRQLVGGSPAHSGGGFFGVQLFFVLSGFLITSLLVEEQRVTGTVHLLAFYGRRVRRLMPALVLVVVCYVVYSLAIDRAAVASTAGDAIRALTYTTNIDHRLRLLPSRDWLGHTWSLAVEEQFYVLWPVAFVVARRRGRDPAAVALVVIGATVLGRQLLHRLGIDIYEITHWDALMIGSLAALRRMTAPKWSGALAAAVLLGAGIWYPGVTASMFLLSEIAAVVLVASAPRMNWLGWRPLRYFGRISYGLYLWHVLLLRPGWPVLPSVVASVIVADLSYRLLERRFIRHRSGGIDAASVLGTCE